MLLGMDQGTCLLGACSVLAWCSLGAHSVLRVFDDARARVLESEHMLGLLGLDAQRVLNKHQGITEWYKMEKITALKAEKSSKFTVDIPSLKIFKRDRVWQQKFR